MKVNLGLFLAIVLVLDSSCRSLFAGSEADGSLVHVAESGIEIVTTRFFGSKVYVDRGRYRYEVLEKLYASLSREELRKELLGLISLRKEGDLHAAKYGFVLELFYDYDRDGKKYGDVYAIAFRFDDSGKLWRIEDAYAEHGSPRW